MNIDLMTPVAIAADTKINHTHRMMILRYDLRRWFNVW